MRSSIIGVLICLIPISFALYEDQIGKFDWRQQFVGKVQFAQFDHNSGNLRITVATEQNVIATLNPRNGQLVWREIMEAGGKVNCLASIGTDVITVSDGGNFVRRWDPVGGFLKWESSFQNAKADKELVSYFHVNPSKEYVVGAWIVPGLHVTFSTLNYKSGSANASCQSSAPWSNTHTSCGFVGRSHFVCADKLTNSLYVVHLDDDCSTFHEIPLKSFQFTGEVRNLELLPVSDRNKDDSLFTLKINSNHNILMREVGSDVTVVHEFPETSNIFVTEIDGQTLAFFSKQDGEVLQFGAYNVLTDTIVQDVKDELHIPKYGNVDKMFVYAVIKKDGGIGYRLLLTTDSDSVLLLQQPGKVVWAREESLASILSVEMVDLPLSESEAQFEKELGSTDGNVVFLLAKRLMTQILRFNSFLASLFSNSDSPFNEITETPTLNRDHFNINKMIVVATAAGKMLGLNSQTGGIIWKRSVPKLTPMTGFGIVRMPLFLQRTTAHYPFPPQCVVLGRNQENGNGMLYVFNPMTGLPTDGLRDGIIYLDYKVLQAVLLPHHDENSIRGLLLLSDSEQIHLFPNTKSAFQSALAQSSSTYLFTADISSGVIRGFSMNFSTEQNLKAGMVWNSFFPPSLQLLTNVAPKSANEHVHSQGRVMGDRSVLYKYLNPNLIVVTTEGVGASQKATLYIHLLDAVTGHVVYSGFHKRAKGPVHVVHSENWIVYAFQNEKSRRVEVAVLELYEGKVQSNTTVFSSLNPPSQPMVETQAYIFPSAIDTIADTITEKGITNKHLLFALPSGGIVELPKALLDPRRPLIPTQEHREEGIIPYIPELPIHTESIINYNQSVFRIRNIATAPTSLESTCLVLAYGLDLFFTRVTPSKTFDVLKDDFDHILIAAVLVALSLGSYLTKRLAARKALRQAWK